MPSYSWTCGVCDHGNPPNIESCESCGFPAHASGAEIERARAARLPLTVGGEPNTESQAPSGPPEAFVEPPQAQTTSRGLSSSQSFFLFCFGVYLLFGAYVTWRDAKWPIFMPPQLDIIGLLLGAFGNPVGAYLGAAFLALLGLACVAVLFLPRRNSDG